MGISYGLIPYKESEFSDKSKALFGESRLIAIEFGYNYISSLHLFLADCQLYQPQSIREFVFHKESEFNNFLESQRIGPAALFIQDQRGEYILDDTLPLTLEAEKVVTNSVVVAKKYKSKMIEPCHIFLSAVEVHESLLYQALVNKNSLKERLVNYYQANGAVEKIPSGGILKNIFSRNQ